MMDELRGRVAVVTGGGSGIGRGISRTFGAEGMTVAVAGLQESKASGGAGGRGGAGGPGVGVGAGGSAVEAACGRTRRIVAEAGGVNLLCANAGVLARVGPLAEHTIGDWEYTMSVNILGIVKTVCAFL